MRNRRGRLAGFTYDETTGIARFSMYLPGTAGRDRKRATVQAASYDEAVRLWSAFRTRAAEGLNLVERFFARLTEQQLRRGTHRTTVQLETAIKTYLRLYNEDPKLFVWHKTAYDILESLGRFCKRISDSGH